MGTEADKMFTSVIKNFSSLQSHPIYSEKFVIGGCTWRLLAFPKGTTNCTNYFSLFLTVAEYNTLPSGWKRHTKYRLTLVNQLSDRLSQQLEQQHLFTPNHPLYGCPKFIALTTLNDSKGGFVVNNEIRIVVEIDILEAIGKLDFLVSEEPQEVTQPLKRTKLNHDGTVDVNGFQVLPSQAESVKLIFEKHPDMALEFRANNQHLRTSCINVLLNLIETLCQSLQDISIDDLSQAEKALTYLQSSGFKVDWLESKLEQVKEMKIAEQIGKTRMQELEEELKVFKKKGSDIEALLEKEKKELQDVKQKCLDIKGMLEEEKAKVLAATSAPPLTLDNIV